MAKRASGMALITAMLVLALASIAAAAVLVSSQMAIRRTGNLVDSEQAWWYAQGAESFVRAALKLDRQSDHDGLDEPWATEKIYAPVDGGGVQGAIEDLQGRFNLNNFYSTSNTVNPTVLGQFQRLFEAIDDLDASQAQPLAEAITDWIDNNQIPIGSGGAEDTDYSSLRLPYRAANQLMKSPSELLALKGMTPEIYKLLSPYVTALPLDLKQTPVQGTRVNINTASLPVLLSLSPSMAANRSQLETWIEVRKKNPADEAMRLSMTNVFPLDSQPFTTVTTLFFQMRGEAFIGSGRVALYSVLMRPAHGADPIVITRSLDTE